MRWFDHLLPPDHKMYSAQAVNSFRIAIAGVALSAVAGLSSLSPTGAGSALAGEASRPGLNPRCTDCHDPDPLFSHPVDFVPSMKIPEGFPLVDGRMTCTTCHDDRWPQAHAAARSAGSSLLRSSQFGIDFCSNCHEQASMEVTDMHAHAISRAHHVWGDGSPSFGVSADKRSKPDYSASSRICMSCHDGFIASSAAGPHGAFSSSGGTAGSTDHPVGLDYRLTSHDTDGRLVPASALDPRIRLFTDRVECESCHSLYSDERNKLVIGTTQTELCLSCHDY